MSDIWLISHLHCVRPFSPFQYFSTKNKDDLVVMCIHHCRSFHSINGFFHADHSLVLCALCSVGSGYTVCLVLIAVCFLNCCMTFISFLTSCRIHSFLCVCALFCVCALNHKSIQYSNSIDGFCLIYYQMFSLNTKHRCANNNDGFRYSKH